MYVSGTLASAFGQVLASQAGCSARGSERVLDSNANGVLIEVHNIHRIYRQGDIEVPALRGVDLVIRKGEFSAIAGASGSGKTTLLNLIGCLDRPTEGSIRVDHVDIGSLNKGQAAQFRLHQIGFVFQAYNLIPVLSAVENAEFILLLQGVSKQARRVVVEPLLEAVGLGGAMHRKPHELSGGQQQRVAIVRAIAAKPSIV